MYTQKRQPSDFYPGLVISTPIHEPDFDPSNIGKLEPRRVDTVLGPVYSKARKLIVIAVFEDHCVTIPIFSFNENGIKFKSNKDDYVAIKDGFLKSTASSENKHPDLKFTRVKEFRNFTNGFHTMSHSSYAYITFPMSFRYILPCIIEGHLTKPSIQQLIDLYNNRAPAFSTKRQFGGVPATSKIQTHTPRARPMGNRRGKS